MSRQRRNIIILDTTLRDGDQSPGFSLGIEQKLVMAGHLENMGVDIIEAGFPASSQGQFTAVQAVAGLLKKSAVSAMARAVSSDIKIAGEAIRNAKCGYIHITVPTSPVHRKMKLDKNRDEVLTMAVEAVKCASGYTDFVEIGAEDAARTELGFLVEFCNAVTSAGASVVNITDTVGYAQPQEFDYLIQWLSKYVRAFRKGTARLSVHCHNDTGLALANTLAGLSAGATQAEVTLLGIGERGGNTALEELAAVLKLRGNYYRDIGTSLDMVHFAAAARDFAGFTGIPAAPCKPVAGRNAFTHGSGIHQDGMLAAAETYTVLSPEDFGCPPNRFVLTRHSGLAGLNAMIKDLTVDSIIADNDTDMLNEFKQLADIRKEVTVTDFLTMLFEEGYITSNIWYLGSFSYARDSTGSDNYTASIGITSIYGEHRKSESQGVTQWDAVIPAMKSLFNIQFAIKDFSFTGAGGCTGISGVLHITAEYEGVIYQDESCGYDCHALFIKSYLNIINRISARYQLTCLQKK